ncbi:serine hydrolase [Mesorhizobium sp. CN2-181]|uniref:serine hydrolase domain-containing protein n=1 Tax=Mesorhizobium yinganensis TaxID=3157707 RepID=UPI0032B7F18E
MPAELVRGGSTAMMVVRRGRTVFEWGRVDLNTSVASVRKSLISALYGILAGEGTLNLDATLEDFGIDDVGGLTRGERRATVRHLLAARSGVYHPSVYDTAHGRPERGSSLPGAAWFYNNWDFNVLGSILEQRSGQSVFDVLYSRLAVPLGMQDFSAADCYHQHGPESVHPVYKLRLSARDLARVGVLYLEAGRWQGRQIVPADWVRDSTRAHTDLGGGRGYGYLWWTAEADAPGDRLSLHAPVFYASGFGGQYVIVVPEMDLVVVHRAARVDHGISHERMGELLRLAVGTMK